jgi:acetyl-CoA acetyltransferase family protein
MPEAVVVATCRTPIGTSYRGSLRDVSTYDLAQHVISGAVSRTGVEAEHFDEIIMGEVLAGGGLIGRYAAVRARLADVPTVALNRQCATGLTAVDMAAANIRAGMNNLVIAGGVHSASTRPVLRRRVLGTDDDWQDPWVSESHPDTSNAPNQDMPVTVGWNTAKRLGINREEMDEWALRSHRNATASIDAGVFVDEIDPLTVNNRDGSVTTFATDEHPRRSSSMEKLAALKPLHPEIDGFSITAGNSSGVNDAAAAVVVASSGFAAEHALPKLAILRSWASVGVEPEATGTSPAKAIPLALKRAGLAQSEVSLFEINEAFASVPLASIKLLDLDPAIVNVNGSGCSLGHPVAATGARMVATMISELRRRGGGIGVVSMCAGGGLGSAAVLEVLPA